MKTIVTILSGVTMFFTTVAQAGIVITCNEKAVVNMEKEKVELGGKIFVLRQMEGGWQIESSNSDSKTNAMINTDLDTCSVNYKHAESMPPQYFLNSVSCQGNRIAADGPKTQLDFAFSSPGSAWGISIVTKRTANVFGQIKMTERSESYDRCIMELE